MKSVSALVAWLATLVTAFGATGLPRSTPEAQGISSSAILGFIESAEEKINSLHSFMLVRRGQVVAEGWWAPYAAEEPHQMFSLSKSFTSTAVGLAVAEGKFAVEDPVLQFFPDEAPAQASANLRAMRVRDLLTMSTGHHNEDIQGFPYLGEESAVKKFLALPVTHKPGTFFVYNTPATFMLSAIVQKTTGQTVLDYLRPRLFEPLGIVNPTWETTRHGVSLGGFGLSIRTQDIAHFGQLYLQKGQWQGKQLVPAEWVASATARWMANGSNPASDWEQGYGFQFWHCRYGVIRGDGAHGQFCVVFPELDAVVAITAGTRDLQGVLNVVWAKLLPALQEKTTVLPADGAGHGRLQQKLAGLTLPTAAAVETPAVAKTITGRRFVFPTNAQAIESITIAAGAGNGGGMTFAAKIDGVEQTWTAAPGAWRKEPVVAPAAPAAALIATSGAWTAADTYTLDVVRYRTPFATRYRMTFAGDTLTLQVQQNVGAPPAGVTIVGRVE